MKNLRIPILFAVLALMALIGYQSVQATAVQQAASSDLAGTSWTLTSLQGQLPLPGTTISLEFGTDGSVSGSDGCNRFTTTFTTTGDSLRIRRPASTMMACPEAVAGQASNFQTMLIAADSYEVRGTQLTLFENDQVVATFIAASQTLGGTKWEVTAYNNGRQAVTSPTAGHRPPRAV